VIWRNCQAVDCATMAYGGGKLFGAAASAARAAAGKTAAAAARRAASSGAVLRAGEAAKRWLGKNYRVTTNRAGDKIFMSKDGLRKLRFDILDSHGDLPHAHLEIFKNGKWVDAIPGTHRLYPR